MYLVIGATRKSSYRQVVVEQKLIGTIYNGANQAHTPDIEGYYLQYLPQHMDSHASNLSCNARIVVVTCKQPDCGGHMQAT